MENTRLKNFLSKFSIGDVTDAVLKIENGELSSKFSPGSGAHFMGIVKFHDMDLPDEEFCIFNAPLLNKMLGVMDSEIKVDFLRGKKGIPICLQITDGEIQSQVVLASPEVVHVPEIKTEPEYEYSQEIPPSLGSVFIKSKSALSDYRSLSIVSDGSDYQLIFNYAAERATDNIAIDLPESGEPMKKPVSFNSDIFSEIFSVNKDATGITLNVSSKGLMKIEFSGPGYTSTYLITALVDFSE